MAEIKMQYWQQLKDPRWQQKRLEILKRANFSCECCSDKPEGEALEIHHKYYQKGLMAWEYPNNSLACFCHGCHESTAEYERVLLASISPKESGNLLDLACAINEAVKAGIGLRHCAVAIQKMLASNMEVVYGK